MSGRPPKNPTNAKVYEKDIRQYVARCSQTIIEKSLTATRYFEEKASRLEAEVKSLRKELLDLQETKDGEIQMHKEACLKTLADRNVNPENDDDVRNNLLMHTRSIKNWAIKYARKSKMIAIDSDIKLDIFKVLSSRPLPAIAENCDAETFFEALQISTILNSLLSKHIFIHLVHDAVFFLRESVDKSNPTDFSSMIDNLYQLGAQENNFASADAWLSQTVEMLHPRRTQNDYGTSRIGQFTETSKKRRYKFCVRSFLNDPSVQPLLKQHYFREKDEASNALDNLVQEFGDYILKLRTQKVRMEALSFDRFEETSLKHLGKSVELHSSCRGRKSYGDSCIDNSWLIVVPAILAYADWNSKRYTVCKVWSSAILMVLPKNDIPSTVSTAPDLTLPAQEAGDPALTEYLANQSSTAMFGNQQDASELQYTLDSSATLCPKQNQQHGQQLRRSLRLVQDNCNRRTLSDTQTDDENDLNEELAHKRLLESSHSGSLEPSTKRRCITGKDPNAACADAQQVQHSSSEIEVTQETGTEANPVDITPASDAEGDGSPAKVMVDLPPQRIVTRSSAD